MLIFLQALLASRKHKGEQEATALLKEAAELHFSGMQGLPLGAEYFEKLDPLFLVCIAREYLFFCPRQVRAGRKAHLHRGSGWGGVGAHGRGLEYRFRQRQVSDPAGHQSALSPRWLGNPVLFRLGMCSTQITWASFQGRYRLL